jgi:small ligand-binding sensory domain FIST
MTRIYTIDDFLNRFQRGDFLWRIVFEGQTPMMVQGPLTIVEILTKSKPPSIHLRDNAGKPQEMTIDSLIDEHHQNHCAVFEYGTEAELWFQNWQQESGRA